MTLVSLIRPNTQARSRTPTSIRLKATGISRDLAMLSVAILLCHLASKPCMSSHFWSFIHSYPYITSPDTGTSIILLPDDIVRAYYNQVSGALKYVAFRPISAEDRIMISFLATPLKAATHSLAQPLSLTLPLVSTIITLSFPVNISTTPRLALRVLSLLRSRL
jgi:hypothetical protein